MKHLIGTVTTGLGLTRFGRAEDPIWEAPTGGLDIDTMLNERLNTQLHEQDNQA